MRICITVTTVAFSLISNCRRSGGRGRRARRSRRIRRIGRSRRSRRTCCTRQGRRGCRWRCTNAYIVLCLKECVYIHTLPWYSAFFFQAKTKRTRKKTCKE